MSIDLPHEVAVVLNMMGVPWPDVDEDDVHRLAQNVRDFAQNVANTHESATGTITDMGSVYSGHSYSALLASWGRMSSTHMADLDQACRTVAGALDMAGNAISVIKIVAIAEITALVGTFLVVLATPGGGPLAPLLSLAARKITTQVEQSVVAYVLAEVVAKALEPFEKAIDDMIKELAYNAASDVLDVPDSSSKMDLYIEPDEVLRYAGVLDSHADDILQHAATFADAVATLDFSMYSGLEPVSGPPQRLPLDLPLLSVPGLAPMTDGLESLLASADADPDWPLIGGWLPDTMGSGLDAKSDEPSALFAPSAAKAGPEDMESAAARGGSSFPPEPPVGAMPSPFAQGGDEQASGPDLRSGDGKPLGASFGPEPGPLPVDERTVGSLLPPAGPTPLTSSNSFAGPSVPPAEVAGRVPGIGDGTAHATPQHGAAQQGSPQQAAQQSPGGRSASGPATPWARAAGPKPGKAEAAKAAIPPPVTAPAEVGSGRTPWSTRDRAADAAKVFAPGGRKTAGADPPESIDVPAKVSAPARSDAPAKVAEPAMSGKPANDEVLAKDKAPAEPVGSANSEAPAKTEGRENRSGADESTAAPARPTVTATDGPR